MEKKKNNKIDRDISNSHMIAIATDILFEEINIFSKAKIAFFIIKVNHKKILQVYIKSAKYTMALITFKSNFITKPAL